MNALSSRQAFGPVRLTLASGARWGMLIVCSAILAAIMGAVLGVWASTALLVTLFPSILLLIVVEHRDAFPTLERLTGSEDDARKLAILLCSAPACVGALVACLAGGIDGAKFAVLLMNGGSATICLWFRGRERETVLAVSPYTAMFFVLLAISALQSHFAAVAPIGIASYLANFIILGAARALALEARTLARDRLNLINDLSAAESENRMGAQRLELALEIADACVYEIRPLERRVIRGETLAPIYGRALTWSDFINPSTLIADADLAGVQNAFQSAMTTPSPFQIEYRIKTASGALKWVQCSGRSFADDEGRIDRLLLMLADISQRKAIESEFKETFQRATNSLRAKRDLIAAIDFELLGRRASAEQTPDDDSAIDANASFTEMSRKLADLTKESETRDEALAQAVNALREARTVADAANAAKSQFLANMSHELRTPLNAVIGYSEIIMEDLLEIGATDLTQDVERVRKSAEHLLHLINSVLDFSKADAGRTDLDICGCDPVAVARDVMEIVQPGADKKGVTLLLETDASAPMQTDPIKLHQCLVNLMSNACKFTSAGSVILRIESNGDGATTLFHVIDTGIGISPGQAARLFEPFMQGDSSITRQFGGTGLGLSITRRFARLLGGDVTLESELGRGAHFTLTVATQLELHAPAESSVNTLARLVDDAPRHAPRVA